MKYCYYLVVGLLLSNMVFAKWETERANWGSLETVLIKDDNFPTYDLVIYFADGAAADRAHKSGETEMMFSQLGSGTRRYSQREISDHLEFYGASYGAYVTHESVQFSISGLAKDIVPTLKKVCHLFQDAQFPNAELERFKRRVKSSLNNMVTNHSALADRAFRVESLRGTELSRPTDGTLKSLSRLSSHDLKQKLDYFKNKVKKRVYYTGPASGVQPVRHILLKECDFDLDSSTFVRRIEVKKPPRPSAKIVLVDVPKANQAQIRVGKYLPPQYIQNYELMSLASGFLGSGFTSLLNQEIRVKRGLSYGVNAVAGRQKYYGRSAIMTFSKNPTVHETIRVIKDTIHHVENGLFTQEELEKSKRFLAGNYLFRFETRSALLRNIIEFDHIGLDYQKMFEFPTRIRELKKKEVALQVQDLFNWGEVVIIVVGSKKLQKELKELGEVKVVSYKNYL